MNPLTTIERKGKYETEKAKEAGTVAYILYGVRHGANTGVGRGGTYTF